MAVKLKLTKTQATMLFYLLDAERATTRFAIEERDWKCPQTPKFLRTKAVRARMQTRVRRFDQMMALLEAGLKEQRRKDIERRIRADEKKRTQRLTYA